MIDTLQLEEGILGALMAEKAAIDRIGSLTPQMFVKNENRYVFEAINDLRIESVAIDLLTIQNKLKKNGRLDDIGGIGYLMQINGKVHIEDLIKLKKIYKF
jgi:replicative DNA helicase